MLIDTHCHLNFKAFSNDAEEVIRKTLENGIWMINVGTNYLTSLKAIDLSRNYKEGVYAAVAFHPIHLNKNNKDDEFEGASNKEEFGYEKFFELGKRQKVVAIGETGLDYYRLKENIEDGIETIKKRQKEVFLKHIKLAQELKKPLIIHCREAHNDLYNILKSNFRDSQINKKGNGVIHCFTGDYKQAKKYLDLGFLLSFTGIITFSDNYNQLIKKLPLDRMMIETDAPYLTPIPYRGKRNEPLYVKYIAYKIADVKKSDFQEIAEQTFNNARELFLI